MCNLYEYEMTAEVMQSLKDHFNLVGTAYLDVLRGHNGPTSVYPNYEAPVIRSLATPASIVRDIVPMRWGFPAPPFYDFKGNVTNVRNVASHYWKRYSIGWPPLPGTSDSFLRTRPQHQQACRLPMVRPAGP